MESLKKPSSLLPTAGAAWPPGPACSPIASAGSHLSTNIRDIDAALPFALDRTCLKQRCDHAAHTAPSGAHTWTGSVTCTKNHELAFGISGRHLQALKQTILLHQQAEQQADDGCRPGRCPTSFEVLAALLRRARTSAVGTADEAPTQLRVWVNFATRLLPPLPRGFMGNCVVRPVCARTTAGRLCSGPLSRAVAQIQRGLASLTDDHARSFIDYCGQQVEHAPEPPGSLFSCFCVNSWMRLGFQLVDLVWGEPMSAGPAATDILRLDAECRLFLLPVCGHGGNTMDINVLVALPVGAATKFEQQLHQELCCAVRNQHQLPDGNRQKCKFSWK